MPLFPGWLVVGGAFAVLFVAYGVQYSFGVFFAAMLSEFGWSRGSLGGAFSLYTFAYCVLGFVAGRLTDRWGPRVVIAAGGVFLGSALAGMSLVTALWQPYVLYGLVASLGMATAFVPCNSTVVRWFVRRRGLAVGLATSGQSAGMLVGAPLAQALVSTAGWRTAYAVFGLTALIGLNAVAPLMRRDPESVGLTPDGDPRPRATVAEPSAGLGDAMRTGAFWALMATFTATWIPVFVPIIHTVPLARDLGYSPLIAASLLSALGAGAVPGRILIGAASDRIGRKRALGLMLLLQALAFVAFIGANSLAALYAVVGMFGFSYGAVTALFPAMISDFFGRDRAGSLVGIYFAVAGAATALGPVGAGAIHDATGSYALAFALSAGCNLAALVALTLARRPPRVGSVSR
ncbi:MAG: MFS transporter [Candidatus Rokubacteria bacterium]|nr:MFS transporter [Candidatus Rokubacteria bacterium]